MNIEKKEHYRAEEALWESFERFRGLAEAAFEGVGIAEQGKIIDANQQLAQMLGYEVKTLIGMDVMTCIAPASRDLVRERIQSRCEKPYEHLALRQDGTIFPVEARAKAVLYKGRSVRVVVIRDLIERKQAEQALRESEERFSKIFYASPVAIAITDAYSAQIIDVNDRFLSIFGFSRNEVIGRSALELGVWHDEWVREEIVERLQKKEKIPDFEAQFLTKSGALCDMRGAVELVELGGRMCLLWMGVDITERRRTEEALRSERAFLNSIVDNIPITVFVKDAQDLRYVRFNKAGEELLGCRREELIGKTDYDLFPEEEAASFVANDRKTLERGEMVDIPEEPIHTRHLGNRILHTRKIPILNEQGRPGYLLGISGDITEHKRREEELIRAKEQAEEMNCLKSAFLANMNHEIRTPLAGIIGFSELLAADVPEPQREYIHLIEQSGRRLLDTLNAVLDLSLLDSGSLTLDLEALDVAEIVERKIAQMCLGAQSKGLCLEMTLPDVEVRALLDRACLDRILHHLIGNAIKFTEQGEVSVTVRAVEDRVEITVHDTGIGISQSFLPCLFEAFKQESTGRARTYEGAGLGLTVTKRMVELMKGKINVQSQKGRGSTFTL